MYVKYSSRILRSFSVNDADVAIAELGTHLKRRFDDVYSLDPRRFEELVCNVFRSDGYDAVLTQQSRDRGVDIIVFDKDGTKILVQCKRNAKTNKVGFEVVQRLVGACVTWDARKATIITTSSFTAPARAEAELAEKHGKIELDLVSASRLLAMLNVYNKDLPPLERLSDKARARIVLQHRNPEPFLSLRETFKQWML